MSSGTQWQSLWPLIYDPDVSAALNGFDLVQHDHESSPPEIGKLTKSSPGDQTPLVLRPSKLHVSCHTQAEPEVLLPMRPAMHSISDQGRIRLRLDDLRPREGPGASDWDAIRPFFESIHSEEKRTLADTKFILQRKFGFEATTKMCKSRIKEWGLRKNLNADEKRKLAAAIKCDTTNGRSLHGLDVDSVRLKRIRRLSGQDEKFRGLVNKISNGGGSSRPLLVENVKPRRHSFPEQNEIPQAQGSTRCTSYREQSIGTGSIASPFPPERPLSVDSALLRVETVLLQARRWTQWHIELEERCSSPSLADERLCLQGSPNPSTTDEAQAKLNTLLSNFEHGAELLARGETKVGWKAIHDGCDLLAEALSQQSTDLLRILLKILSEAQWAHFPTLRKELLHFFAKMSAKQLGVSNPLTVVLFHLLDEEVLLVAIRPVLEVLIDLQSAVDSRNWRFAALKRNLVTFLTYNVKDLVKAEALGISNVKHCELIYGCDHRRTRRSILQLGAIYHASQQYRLAFERYKDVIDRDDIYDGYALDWISITACRSLANVCESQGDMQGSESCWHVALSNTGIKYGMGTAAAVKIVHRQVEGGVWEARQGFRILACSTTQPGFVSLSEPRLLGPFFASEACAIWEMAVAPGR